MTFPSITLCVIVKDEEETIAACLSSAAPVVDDIVVVDTGSTDDTMTIAKHFAQHLHRFEWREDFAAARNFALDQARGDWVLWLDGDEELVVEDRDLWFDSFREKAGVADGLPVELRNFYGSVLEEHQYHLYAGVRLLRRAAKFRYKQAVHEHLDLERGTYRLDREPVAGLHIRHYGYMDAFVEKKQKHRRNMALLQKERVGTDYDPWIDYHVAGEHYRRRNFAEALTEVNVALRRFLSRGELPPALAYKLKYEILMVTGSWDNALPGVERALALYPDYVDLHYYKGLFQYGRGQYEEALKTFAACLRMGENARYLTLMGTGSFMAQYMLGMTKEALGRREEAVKFYERAGRAAPRFGPARERLHVLQSETEADVGGVDDEGGVDDDGLGGGCRT